MTTIAFLVRELHLRGTCVASYSYADAAETVLGHRPIVFFDLRARHDSRAAERFGRRFSLVGYESEDDLDRLLARERVDLMHVQKGDRRDCRIARAAPTAVHQVFPAFARDAHGSAYAYISCWLARVCAGDRGPCVPYIVALPPAAGDLRHELGIPADALALGCHGGADSFDLECARRALAAALERRRDLWFVGLNLTPFLKHERAVFLPGVFELKRKRAFLETCDAMLHARARGETFGLAVAEFSVANRPVLTPANTRERAHLEMLGDAALLYRGERDLLRQLLALDRAELKRRDWDRYSAAYAAAPVMRRFQSVFVDNPVDPAAIRAARVGPEDFSLDGLARYLRRRRREWAGKAP